MENNLSNLAFPMQLDQGGGGYGERGSEITVKIMLTRRVVFPFSCARFAGHVDQQSGVSIFLREFCEENTLLLHCTSRLKMTVHSA